MLPPRTALYLAVVTGLLLSSCGSSRSSFSPSQSEELLTAPSDPISLDLDLATDLSVSALMASDGGTLTAVGPDGTRYTLEVPEGALYAPTEITMTPSADVGGLPFGEGSTFAVKLEPEGLRFSDVAVLTIEPAQDIPIEEQVFFSFEGRDNDFYLAPPVVDSNAIQIPITHFSGYGVSKGLAADIEPVRKRLGGSVEARLNAILANHLTAARQRAMLGAGDEESSDADFYAWFLKTWYYEVLKPRLDAAKESCPAGRLAILTILGMERQLQLLGVEGGVAGTLRAAGLAGEANAIEKAADLAKEVLDVCLKEEYELCRDEHILHRIVPVALSIERQAQMLGADSSGLYEKAMGYAAQCLRFRLEFESNLEGNYMGQFTYETERSATLQLSFNPAAATAGNAITGKGPLTSDSFDIHLEGCTTQDADGGESDVEVTALQWDVAFNGPEDKIGHVSDLALEFSPGVSEESYRFKCGPQYADSGPSPAIWSGAFGSLWAQACRPASTGGDSGSEPAEGEIPPEILSMIPPGALPGQAASGPSGPSESAPSVGGLISPSTPGLCSAGRGWQVSGGDEFASMEWDRSAFGLHDEGSFTLHHTPN